MVKIVFVLLLFTYLQDNGRGRIYLILMKKKTVVGEGGKKYYLFEKLWAREA